MGNNNSSEIPERYPQPVEAEIPQSENIYARPRINRLAKPRVGAPTQPPITAALTRTLSSRALNGSSSFGPGPGGSNGNSPLPMRRRADSVDALYRSESRSHWYGAGDPEGYQSVQLSRTNSFVANPTAGVQLSRTNSFIANAADHLNLKRRSWVSESNFQLRDFEPNHSVDYNDPPMTASSTDSSYHSASQSPVPPDPLIPVRRKSLLLAAAPGTATRPPKPVAVDPPPDVAAEVYPEAPGYVHTDSIIAKLAALDLAGERCETPNELQLLGSLRKGTLFVTNGAPSPVPSSPELRSTSWGSTRRIPSLPQSMLAHSESSRSDPLPTRTSADLNQGEFEDNDVTPRKAAAPMNRFEESEGQKKPSAPGRPDVRLDTKSPVNKGVRLVPPSPADENIYNNYSAVNSNGSEQGAYEQDYSYSSPAAAAGTDTLNGPSQHLPYNSTEQSQPMPAGTTGLKRSTSIIVVGTVAETVPDSASFTNEPPSTVQQQQSTQTNTARHIHTSSGSSERAMGEFTAEKPNGESMTRTGTDSGYSSTGSFFSRKSWRRSRHGRGNSINDPTTVPNWIRTTINGKHVGGDATDPANAADDFTAVPYMSTAPGNDQIQMADTPSPQTPKKAKQSSHSPLSERVKNRFTSKSTSNTPETTPTNTPTKNSNTPTKKLFSRGRLSFRRKSDAAKKLQNATPEAPSTDSFQIMKGTLPFDGRSFKGTSVYELDYERKSPLDPHRIGEIPTPPMPVYSRRNSIDLQGSEYAPEPVEPQRSFAPRGANSAPATPLDNAPYIFEAVALTCDTPVTHQPQLLSKRFSTPSPGPSALTNDKDRDAENSASSSNISLPSLNYDESELPPMPSLPPPPVPQERVDIAVGETSASPEQDPFTQDLSVGGESSASAEPASPIFQAPVTPSRTPAPPRSPISPQAPIMQQPTPSRAPASYTTRQYRKVATPPPPTTPPTFRTRQGYNNNNNNNSNNGMAMNDKSPLRKSPGPAAFYPPSSFRPPSLRGRSDFGFDSSRPRSSDGESGTTNNNNYTYGTEKAQKRRSLGATVLSGKSRRSGESDRERWGVDLSDIPIVKAEELVNGYGSYRPGRSTGDYGIDEREMFVGRSGVGMLDGDDDDDDDELDFELRRSREKKEKRSSWWRRRSKSRSRSTVHT